MYKIEKITKELFGEPRTIRVYVPSDASISNRYPVLYMHDGHNLFDPKDSYSGVIWDVHNALENIQKEYHKNCIVVGIDCHPTNRLTEYSPWLINKRVRKQLNLPKNAGGKGKEYIDWLVTKLKPYIDQIYPTNPKITYMAGSSMGGLISLYGGYRYPAVFSKVGCFSSAFWFSRKQLLHFLKENHIKELGVYLDVGTSEVKNKIMNVIYKNDTIKVKNLLEKKGTTNLKFLLAEGGTHSEKDWQMRFPGFVKWLLDIKN